MTDDELKPWLEKKVTINDQYSGVLVLDPEPQDGYNYKLLCNNETVHCTAKGIKKIALTGSQSKNTPVVVKKIDINGLPFLHIYFSEDRDILINIAHISAMNYNGIDTTLGFANGKSLIIRNTHWGDFV